MKRRGGRIVLTPSGGWRACLVLLLLAAAMAWPLAAAARVAFPSPAQSPSEWVALLLSCAIEAPIAFFIVRLARWPCRGPLHAGLASAVATAVTHPQAWTAALWAYPHFGYWPTVVAIESLVVLAEALLIAWMAALSPGRSLMVSLAANSASTLFGIVFFR